MEANTLRICKMKSVNANLVPPAVRAILNWVRPYSPKENLTSASTALLQVAECITSAPLNLANN